MKKEMMDKINNLPEQLREVGITLQEIKEAREAIGAVPANSTCGECKTIVEWVVGKLVATGGCPAMGAALAGIFLLAEIVFFEFDEIIVPVEAVAEGVLETMCVQYGAPWIKDHASEVAEAICKAAGQC